MKSVSVVLYLMFELFKCIIKGVRMCVGFGGFYWQKLNIITIIMSSVYNHQKHLCARITFLK